MSSAADVRSPSQVTVVTVTHFSAKVIGRWLEALPPGTDAIVVDNASQDDTCAIVQAHGRARLIANTANRGFGAAMNQGIFASQSEFILLLNPDAQLRPDCLPALLAAAARYPEAGLLAPGLYSPQGAWEVSHDVDMFRRLALPSRRSDPEPTGDICADFLSGAAMLLRRGAVAQINGFDPAIFLYYEDDDLCLRLRRAGWSLIRVAAAMTDHVGGGSVGFSLARHWRKYRHIAWSRLYIERKYNGSAAMWRTALPALVRYAVKAPFYLVFDFRGKGLRDAARFAGTLAYLAGRRAI